METGSKMNRLVIGARELRDQLGRYLVQGLVASVFMHSAVVAIVGLWPKSVDKVGQEIVIEIDKWGQRPPKPDMPTERRWSRPKPPKAPEVVVNVPVDNPEEIDTTKELKEDFPDMRGTVIGADTGDSGKGFDGGFAIDSSIEIAGYDNSTPIFIPREIDPVPLMDINPQPEYPKIAKLAGIEGLVRVWVHVGVKGDVIGWQVIDVKPAGRGFEDEVARVIPKWKFTPAIQQNNPIAVWVAIPFKFRVTQ